MEKTKFLIVSKFEDSNFIQKVQNFKKRLSLDLSFTPIHLPLIAPFELKDKQSHVVFDEFEEEFQSFFIDKKDTDYIKFKNFRVYQNKKKFLLYLNPVLSTNLEYCLESLNEIKRGYTKTIKSKEARKPYLVLGKFHNERDLEEALQRAAKEFILPVEIKVKGFSLFLNRSHGWQEGKSFLTFENQNHLEAQDLRTQLVV